MVQEEEGTIFSPVWSQFSMSSGGISSIVTVATTSFKNDFCIASKLVIVYFDFEVVAFRSSFLEENMHDFYWEPRVHQIQRFETCHSIATSPKQQL